MSTEVKTMKIPEWRVAPPRRAERMAWLAFAFLLLAGLALALAWYLRTAAQYAAYQLHTGDAVSGLLVDAPVEFHGVEVGRVARISLDGPRAVGIVLRIRKDTPVSSATVATITTRGLAARGFMGYVVVALEDGAGARGAPAFDPASHLPVIAVGPSRSLSLDRAISTLDANVQTLSALAQTALNRDALAALDASLRNLERVSNTLAANSERLNAILANADRVGRQVEPLVQAGGATLRAMQTQVLPEAYRTLAEMDALSRSMAGMADRLNRNPSLLLRGSAGAPPGPGESDGRH
jgi:phospholipid/cholesterol/gamma-HCH transport system substrate-binding protein